MGPRPRHRAVTAAALPRPPPTLPLRQRDPPHREVYMSGPVPPLPLNSRTLPYWSGRLPVPAYDRALVTPGVVHVGVGGFHRAHQAMYHDRMMNEGAGLGWGICGVGV